MRIIAFITDSSTVRDVLAQLGTPTMPPRIAPARGPLLWQAAKVAQDSPPDPALSAVCIRLTSAADSTDRCNSLVESFGGCFVVQCFSWALIQSPCHCVELCL